MEDTKTQLLAVVNNLSNEAVKQNLAAKINSGSQTSGTASHYRLRD